MTPGSKKDLLYTLQVEYGGCTTATILNSLLMRENLEVYHVTKATSHIASTKSRDSFVNEGVV